MNFEYTNAGIVFHDNQLSNIALPKDGNATLYHLEKDSVLFSLQLNGPASITIPMKPQSGFDIINIRARLINPVPGTLKILAEDSSGKMFEATCLSVSSATRGNEWKDLSCRLEDFSAAGKSPSGRQEKFNEPLQRLALRFSPSKEEPGKNVLLKLDSVSFTRQDPRGTFAYPLGNRSRMAVDREHLEMPKDTVSPNLPGTHYMAMIYECGDDAPYTWYDKTDKFILFGDNVCQLAYQDKDSKALCLAAYGPSAKFSGKYKIGTIVTDKLKMYGGELFFLDIKTTEKNLVPDSVKLFLEFTDATKLPIPVDTNMVSAGKRHSIKVELPEKFSGKKLAFLTVEFKNQDGKWGEMDLFTLSVARRKVNNRIDADQILKMPPRHNVRVEQHHGKPVIMIDNEPITGMGFANQSTCQASDEYWDNMLNKINCRTPLGRLVIPTTEDIYLLATPHIWIGPDHFDFSYLDTEMNRLSKLSPESKFILYIQLEGVKWWNYLHPRSAGVDFKRGVPDYMSPEWKKDMRDMIRQCIAHIQTQPYAEAIIGYEIWGGPSLDNNVEINDATPQALERFRTFLKNKYQTVSALRSAWKDSKVGFDNAAPQPLISGKYPYRRDAMTLLVDPSRRAYLDNYEFRSNTYQQMIIDACEAIKEATHNRALTGARTGNFIGGQWCSFDRGFPDTNYEPGIDLLLKSPYFDLFELQEPYPGRALGYDGGIGTPNIPADGAAMHNKLIIVQNDYPWGYNLNLGIDEQRKHTRRVYSHAIMSGLYPYEWCVGPSHYRLDKPGVLEEYRQIVPVFEKALQVDRSSVAETAFVCDLNYKKYLGYDSLFKGPARTVSLFDVSRYTWSRAGLPFDFLFIDQIEQARPYKLYVFFHTYELSDKNRKLIEDMVRNKGCVAIFIWADFLLDGKSADPVAMSNLIGMNIDLLPQEKSWKLKASRWFERQEKTSELYPIGDVRRFQHQGWQPSQAVPSNNTYSPSFVVKDPAANPIAYYEGTKDVAAAVKKVGKGWCIYSAAATLSPSVLRYAGKLAGCFEYTGTEDAFLANKSLIFIHSGDTHAVKLKLPEKQSLYEVYSGKELSEATEFELNVEKGQTYLFFRGSQKQWEHADKEITSGNATR